MSTNRRPTLLSFLFLTFLLPAFRTFGQDTTFFDHEWNKVSSLTNATYFKIVEGNQTDANGATEKVYFKSGQIKTQKDYAVYANRKLNGKSREWFESGQISRDIDYRDGKKEGQLLTYWANGKLKRADRYENDTLVEGKCMTPEGKKMRYYDYEKDPEFPGGINNLAKYLAKEIKYPKYSNRAGIEGRVLVRFVVNKDGTLSDARIIERVSQEIDEEAMRVVKKMAKWAPAIQDGEAISAIIDLPIHFQLR